MESMSAEKYFVSMYVSMDVIRVLGFPPIDYDSFRLADESSEKHV